MSRSPDSSASLSSASSSLSSSSHSILDVQNLPGIWECLHISSHLQRCLMCILVRALGAMPASLHFSGRGWCLSFFPSLFQSLFLLLCVILADQCRGRNTMIVFSPNNPPFPNPPLVFSLSVSQRRGEIYSAAAMLMRISLCLNSLLVKGIRADNRKSRALCISL